MDYSLPMRLTNPTKIIMSDPVLLKDEIYKTTNKLVVSQIEANKIDRNKNDVIGTNWENQIIRNLYELNRLVEFLLILIHLLEAT